MITEIKVRRKNENVDREIVTAFNEINYFVDVTYTNSNDVVNCGVIINAAATDYSVYNELVGDFKLLQYGNITSTNATFTKTFVFQGTGILNGLIENYSDVLSLEKNLDYLPEFSKEVRMTFYSDNLTDVLDLMLVTSSSQVGQDKVFENILKGETKYWGAEELPVYIYFFLDTLADLDVVDDTQPPYIDNVAITDFDDVIFIDFDDYYFRGRLLE